MQAALFGSTMAIVSLAAWGAYAQEAQEADIFARWVDGGAPECVPVGEFASVSRVVELNPEQFQFVRALYVAIPPVSRTLPAGDRAVMARAGDETMLALVADNLSCARFLAPDFVVEMLMQVGKDNPSALGQATSLGKSAY